MILSFNMLINSCNPFKICENICGFFPDINLIDRSREDGLWCIEELNSLKYLFHMIKLNLGKAFFSLFLPILICIILYPIASMDNYFNNFLNIHV